MCKFNMLSLQNLNGMRNVRVFIHSFLFRLGLAPLLIFLEPGIALAMDGFVLPSRNIYCVFYSGVLSCDVIQHKWASWGCEDGGCRGTRFQLRQQGPAIAIRSSDSMAGSNWPVLAYGRSIRRGTIQCVSATEGLTCTNNSGGRLHLNRLFYTFR
jgi:hypothetical protein